MSEDAAPARLTSDGEDLLSFADAVSAEPLRLTEGGPKDRAHFSYVAGAATSTR